jgi:signal transduction histidine kinase
VPGPEAGDIRGKAGPGSLPSGGLRRLRPFALDYLAEVPLIALMFLVMVLHGRRRLAATAERLTAMEQVQRISQENVRLLEQQRQFLIDASHELGTPITRVVIGELARLRRLTNRMLLLASAGTPGFLRVAPVVTDSLVLDALLENAVAHTQPGDRIEVSVALEDGHAVIGVADSGCGIAPDDLARIFGRFARAEPYRSREAGGFGLGLPIVQAIAEAHHGSVRVRSSDGHGTTFEMVIPAAR